MQACIYDAAGAVVARRDGGDDARDGESEQRAPNGSADGAESIDCGINRLKSLI
jgi:hypothetical protein